MAEELEKVLGDEGKRLKAVHNVFVKNPEGVMLLEEWVKEFVHYKNPKMDPLVEGRRIFVLELLEDTLQNLNDYYEKKED